MPLLYFVIECMHVVDAWPLQNFLCSCHVQVFGANYPRGVSKGNAWNIGTRPPTTSIWPAKTQTCNRFHWNKPLYELLCKGLHPLSVWTRTRVYKDRRFCSNIAWNEWHEHWRTGVCIWNPVYSFSRSKTMHLQFEKTC